MTLSFISIKKFSEKPYSNILGYPAATKRQLNARIKELEKLGIKSISLKGPTTIGKLEILGKGYVGVVVLAKRGNKKVALKIRRIDSQREDMKNESDLLKLVNSVGVGPEMMAVSKNFLVMEYLNGIKISDWVYSLKGKGITKRLKSTIKKVLVDCYKLDQIDLDHGELSNISKHVIVEEKKSTLIDFESASKERRPSNVTSITQAIFIGSGIAKKVQRIYKNPPKEEIISILKKYKNEKTLDNFNNLLQVLKL